MPEQKDDDNDTAEATVLGGCEHELFVGNEDGSVSKLVPTREGAPMPPGATAIARVRRSSDPGKVSLQFLHRRGPAKVATDSYRKGWDGVFKKQLDPTLN